MCAYESLLFYNVNPREKFLGLWGRFANRSYF